VLVDNISVIDILRSLLLQLRARLALLHRDEAGYSTEAVIVTALLVLAAITAIGYIAAKVAAKAKGLSLE
jgi:hypothetical protein